MTYQKRITCGAAALLMASMVVASVGLLFSNPSAAADDPAIKRGQYLSRSAAATTAKASKE